jgi:hypothetical protein
LAGLVFEFETAIVVFSLELPQNPKVPSVVRTSKCKDARCDTYFEILKYCSNTSPVWHSFLVTRSSECFPMMANIAD